MLRRMSTEAKTEVVPHAYAQAVKGEMYVTYAYSQAQAAAAMKNKAKLPEGRVRDIIYTHPTRGNVEATRVVSREDALKMTPPAAPIPVPAP